MSDKVKKINQFFDKGKALKKTDNYKPVTFTLMGGLPSDEYTDFMNAYHRIIFGMSSDLKSDEMKMVNLFRRIGENDVNFVKAELVQAMVNVGLSVPSLSQTKS